MASYPTVTWDNGPIPGAAPHLGKADEVDDVAAEDGRGPRDVVVERAGAGAGAGMRVHGVGLGQHDGAWWRGIAVSYCTTAIRAGAGPGVQCIIWAHT
jgi:hypothetical protein